ncbi:MAG: hypothetical protein GX492_05260 [Firmicutes bacterium]|nr:hypothetical protein [Bacillota bacterium]
MSKIEFVTNENYNPADPDAIIVVLYTHGREIVVRRRDLEEPQAAPRKALPLVPEGGQK